MSWIRLDVDTFADPVVGAMDPVGRYCWVALLLTTKRYGEPGGTLAGAIADPHTLARLWAVSETEAAAFLAVATAGGVIATATDGAITVTQWSQYQRDPTGSRRQASKRAKSLSVTQRLRDVTQRQRDVTLASRKDVDGDGDVDRDMDGDKDDRKKQGSPRSPARGGSRGTLNSSREPDPLHRACLESWIRRYAEHSLNHTEPSVNAAECTALSHILREVRRNAAPDRVPEAWSDVIQDFLGDTRYEKFGGYSLCTLQKPANLNRHLEAIGRENLRQPELRANGGHA